MGMKSIAPDSYGSGTSTIDVLALKDANFEAPRTKLSAASYSTLPGHTLIANNRTLRTFWGGMSRGDGSGPRSCPCWFVALDSKLQKDACIMEGKKKKKKQKKKKKKKKKGKKKKKQKKKRRKPDFRAVSD